MTFPSSWTQSAWFIDPQNSSGTASDGNTGLTSGTALRTWGEVIARMGTISPALNQLTTFTFLSAQTANTDFIFFTPQLSNGSQAVITALGAATNTGAAFSAGALGGGFGSAGAAPSAGGTPMTIASVPVYVVAGTLLHNTTRNSYAFVDSVAGGTAKVTQPHTVASTTTTTTLPAPAVDNDWVAGDNIQPLTLLSLNVKRWAPVGGDLTAGNQPCAGWIIGASIADSSGTGSAEYPFVSTSAVQVLSLCNVNPRIAISNSEGRTVGCQLISCYSASFVNQFGGAVPQIYGGVVKSGINVYSGLLSVNNNAVLHGSTLLNNGPSTLIIQAGGAFSDGSVTAILGCSIGATGIFWGSYSVTLDPGATYWNVTGSTFAAKALLTTGALSLGANTSGYAASSTGFYGPFPITPSTLDGYNGLQDPLTGAKFFNTSISSTLPVNPTSWTQTDWYLDGVSGNDANSGAFGSPVKTIMGGIVAKWGTTSPIIAQTTTIHVLNGQTSGLERAILTPILSGTSANFVIVGTPSNIGSTFAAGTVTQLVEGNPGNDLQIANMPVGAAAGVLVFNSTRNSYAIIDSMNSTTAIMQQPFSAAALTTVAAILPIPSGVVWSTGDTLQMSSLPILNLEVLSPVGGDGNSSFTTGACWTQMIHIPDVSGTTGDIIFSANPQGPSQTFSLCNIDPSIVSSASAAKFQLVWMSCTLSGEVMLDGGFQTLYGGSLSSFGANFSNTGFFGEGGIYRETIAHGAVNSFSGDLFINSLHIIGTLSVNAGAAVSFGSHPIWGAGSIQSGGVFLKVGAATWASSLLVSSVQINSNSFGYASAGQYTYGPFALTAANLDGYGGLHGGSSPQAVFSNGSASVPTTPVSWTQTDWYLDGYAGNDVTGDGSFSKPVKTITNGIIPRWGTASPILAQTTTIHVLAGQASGLERAVLSPIIIGQNTNFAIIGTPSNIASTFTAGTVTPKSQGAPGIDLTIANMQAGAAAGDLVFNSTRGSYAFIRAMGGSTATMCQPFTTASLTTISASATSVQDNTWATGDTLQRMTVPGLNLSVITPAGGDTNPISFTNGVCWLQMLHVLDPTGTPGDTDFTIAPVGCQAIASLCWLDGLTTVNAVSTAWSPELLGCFALGGVTLFGGTQEVVVSGGYLGGAVANNATIKDDSTVSSISIEGDVQFFGVHVTISVICTAGSTLELRATSTPGLWGQTTVTLYVAATVWNRSAQSWANQLQVSGLLSFASDPHNSVGYALADNGILYGPILITSANLDTYGGLSYPQNGAQFSVSPTVVNPKVPVTWTQTDWYVSKSTGNDLNPGTISSPVKTVMGGIVPRWGTTRPILPQTTTIHITDTQAVNDEAIVLEPIMTGQSNFVIIGTTTNVGSTFSAGTVTPKSQGNPGTRLTIASMPVGAAAGVLIFNSTRGSYALIDSMNGTTATVCQPFTTATVTTIVATTPNTATALDNGWATGNTLQLMTLPILNLRQLNPEGGDGYAGFPQTSSVCWTQWVHVPDMSGTPGDSAFTPTPRGLAAFDSLCIFDPFVVRDGSQCGYQIVEIGCQFNGASEIGYNATQIGGSTTFGVFNQSCQVGASISIATGASFYGGEIFIGDINIPSGIYNVQSGEIVMAPPSFFIGEGFIWGGGTLNLGGTNASVRNNTTDTWANRLQVAALQILGSTVGVAYVPNTSTWHSYIPLTSANLDAWGTLQGGVNGGAGTMGGGIFCGTSVPTLPPTWSQSTWYYDPQNSTGTASDNNSGLTSGAALRTWHGVIEKIGTTSPILAYGQSMTFNKLSAHSANTDPVSFTPILSGGGQAIHIDTLVVKSAAFTGGTVTARNQTTGQLLAVAGFPAGTAAGDYVFNQTRGSYANVFVGGTTPTFTTPVPTSVVTTPGIPTLAEDNTWTTGDTFIVYTRPLLNLQQWEPVGGDLGGAGNNTASCGWVQWSQIPDSSGSGGSVYIMRNRSATNVFSGCQFLSRVHVSALGGRGFASYLLNTDHAQTISVIAAGDVMMWGINSRNSFSAASGGFAIIDGGSIAHGTNTISNWGVVQWGDAYTDTLTNVREGGLIRLGVAQGGATAAFWGGGALTVFGMAACELNTGTFAAAFPTGLTLKLGNNTTGYAVASNYTYGPFLLTPANLDTYNGLIDPNDGGRFYALNGIAAGIIVPLTWSQATWFIDPTNSQGTSSDNNSGLTSGTALLTWKGFLSKMGGTTTTQHSVASVAITFLSSHTDNTDPVVWNPQSSNNCVLSIQGAAPTTTAAVFTLNTAKNRTAGANALLSGSFSAGAPATGMMVQNTTAAKSSRAFIYTSAGGSNWNITQPLAPQSVPTTTLAPTQINTWASTDTVNLLAPVQVNIARFEPTIIDTSATTDNYAYLYQMIVFDPGGVGKDDCYLNGSVQVQEVSFQRNMMIVPGKPVAGTSLSHSLGHINVFYQHYLMGSNGGQDNIFFVGGASASGVQMSGRFTFDGDFIVGGFFNTFASTIGIGFFYLDGIVATSNTGTLVTFINQLYGGHVVYGSATANWNFVDKSMGLMFSGTYTAGWTAPLFISTGVQLNGASTGHSLVSGTPDVLNGGIATTVANLDAAASSTGFGGTAFNLGRATVTNAA